MIDIPAKKRAVAKALAVNGWLTRDEAGVLYELAARSTGPIIEIGSWHGRSTVALALGSEAGGHHLVYAIDSFVGAQGVQEKPSEAVLRGNLNAIGINGTVEIVAMDSAAAASILPDECGLVWIDGAHDHESVRRDLDNYLPKIAKGGYVMLHDCDRSAPGVVQAVDEALTADPAHWRCRWRVDSAIIFQRCESIRHTVLLGFPGGSLCYGTHAGLAHATLGAHDVTEEQSGLGWDDMNRLWCFALNQAHAGQITHFAMLHSDVQPSPGWIDLLLDELDDRNGDFISAIVALKDDNGLTSCGIGDGGNPWAPFRRFTVRELMEMPETFSVADTPHPDRYLLHNTGCWVADLRSPLWRTVDADGALVADFSFPIRGRMLPSGVIEHERESEDWHFSRKIAELGLRTFATRRVATIHFGQRGFRNDHAWGRMEHDEATAEKWGAECPIS